MFVPRDETWEWEGVGCSSSKSRNDCCDHEEEPETVASFSAGILHRRIMVLAVAAALCTMFHLFLSDFSNASNCLFLPGMQFSLSILLVL